MILKCRNRELTAEQKIAFQRVLNVIDPIVELACEQCSLVLAQHGSIIDAAASVRLTYARKYITFTIL